MISRSITFRFWKYTVVAVSFFFLLQNVFAQIKSTDAPALIPQPQKISWNNQIFRMDGNESRVVTKMVTRLSGVVANREEAYRLKVTSDSIVLQAETAAGLFRGQQTLNQLTTVADGKRLVAGCEITDWPAFQIRGFMQDVGRNFMSLPMLKEQIDVMAAYKFNTFHFHVTDNPGWRLESKKYPQLSAASSNTRWPGKYYSQEDFLELVNYCNERFITLVPELDIPGHCEAFRKAFALDSMSDPRVQPILLDLIDELCALVPAEKMPYIHLGTDEVWHSYERPAAGLLDSAVACVKKNGREVIVWRPGQQIDSDRTSITQLWSSNGKPKDGHRYIDSRLNYLNHLDPLAGVAQLYFDRICNAPEGDSLRLGGILCCWNDNNVNEEYDILRQNPVYPGMLTYSETSWKGQQVDFGEQFLAKLPSPENPLFQEFQEFENRLVEHRDRYFQGKPFPYVKQTGISWKIYGPLDHKGEVTRNFTGEEAFEKNIPFDYRNYAVTEPVFGGTIHVRHFFGFPSWFSEKQGTVFASTNIWSPVDQQVSCWIGFHDWSRSGGRRGGPFPQQGQWHSTNPKVWLNRKLIEPPVWKNPGLAEKTEEIPFSDENYFFREPTTISLKRGWNEVVLKVPHGGTSWKWMFTFVPVQSDGVNMREVSGIKYSVENEK
ncbi:MAG: family 20 glycosylhydrolase [Prolixibacteraceae bacterium]|nr:family 20 glycosylhydrolase [Prolixibacteraceae bacterium]